MKLTVLAHLSPLLLLDTSAPRVSPAVPALVAPYGDGVPQVSTGFDHDEAANGTLYLDGTRFHATVSDNHYGIDWELKPGHPIVSASHGVVTQVIPSVELPCRKRRRGTTGETVFVRVSDGVELEYGSLQDVEVVPGAIVRPGDQLGAAHSARCVPAAMLHFAVWRATPDGWCAVDPEGPEAVGALGGRLPLESREPTQEEIDKILLPNGKLAMSYDLPYVPAVNRLRCVRAPI
jgi:murein DD-endopeptidase MepM/ murein hydrolase activator NlpD